MIEAEWWDYESSEELAEAVAGDVGFIISSAVEARSASLIALPAGPDEHGNSDDARRANRCRGSE